MVRYSFYISQYIAVKRMDKVLQVIPNNEYKINK